MSQITPDMQNFIDQYSIKDATFKKEVLESDIPVMVFFWAPWCGPCRAMLPVAQELAREYPDNKLKIVLMNTNENMIMTINDTTKRGFSFTVIALPAFAFFKEGTDLNMILGALPKSAIDREIMNLFNLSPAAPSRNPERRTGSPAIDPH